MCYDLLTSVLKWKGERLTCHQCGKEVDSNLYLSFGDRMDVQKMGFIEYHYTCGCGQVALISHSIRAGTVTGEWLNMDSIRRENQNYLNDMQMEN